MVRVFVVAAALGCCAAASPLQGSSQRLRSSQDAAYLQTTESKGMFDALSKSQTTNSKFPLIPDSMMKRMGIHDGSDGPVYGFPASEVKGGGMPADCGGLCYDAPWGPKSNNPICLCGNQKVLKGWLASAADGMRRYTATNLMPGEKEVEPRSFPNVNSQPWGSSAQKPPYNKVFSPAKIAGGVNTGLKDASGSGSGGVGHFLAEQWHADHVAEGGVMPAAPGPGGGGPKNGADEDFGIKY